MSNPDSSQIATMMMTTALKTRSQEATAANYIRRRLKSHRNSSSSSSRSKSSVVNNPCRIAYCCCLSTTSWSLFATSAVIVVCWLLIAAEELKTIQCQEIQANHRPTLTEGLAELDHLDGVVPSPAADSNTPTGMRRTRRRTPLRKRSPAAAPSMPGPMMMMMVMPVNELRVSGSKSEPPSRPSVDWSKQRPHFGPDMARNVSVELGKTAYLTCKVFELGDKTVSWLRPRENEILTAGRYTYIGDPRFASINDNGSHDWILEIKDVGLNDSTSYECQVSTDPKMSAIINLQVKATKARIRQGEQFYAPLGSNIEFSCEIGQRSSSSAHSAAIASASPPGVQQTYWYQNGNLLNYARTHSFDRNFSIDWDQMTQTSRFKLFNLQVSDAGNYTCKPTSAEPATIRLHVKKPKSGAKDKSHHGNGHHAAGTKEAQRNRQHYSEINGLEYADSSTGAAAAARLVPSPPILASVWTMATLSSICLLKLLLLTSPH